MKEQPSTFKPETVQQALKTLAAIDAARAKAIRNVLKTGHSRQSLGLTGLGSKVDQEKLRETFDPKRVDRGYLASRYPENEGIEIGVEEKEKLDRETEADRIEDETTEGILVEGPDGFYANVSKEGLAAMTASRRRIFEAMLKQLDEEGIADDAEDEPIFAYRLRGANRKARSDRRAELSGQAV